MSAPIETGLPAILQCFIEFLAKHNSCRLLCQIEDQCLPKVLEIIDRGDLRNARGEHHGEEGNDEITATANNEEGLLANILETFKVRLGLLTIRNDVHKVVCQYKWNTLTANAKLFLK